ncbi:MAG: hypothetical protein ACRETA_05725 [Gammaproteobacteria bacterium]
MILFDYDAVPIRFEDAEHNNPIVHFERNEARPSGKTEVPETQEQFPGKSKHGSSLSPVAEESAAVGAVVPAANSPGSLAQLQQTARDRKNIFASLMEAVKYNSLGQISHALYEVGGEYRRNM